MISRRNLALGLAGAAMSNATLAEMVADSDGTTHQHADDALVSIIQEWQSQSPHTPGVAVGVRFADGYIWNRGFGLADLTTERPMPANEYMRIAVGVRFADGYQAVDEVGVQSNGSAWMLTRRRAA
jgi:phage-related protein